MKKERNILKLVGVLFTLIIAIPIFTAIINGVFFKEETKYMELIFFGVSSIFGVILFYINREELKKSFKKINKKSLLNVLFIYVILMIISVVYSLITDPIVKGVSENQQIVTLILKRFPIISFFAIVFSAPFVEEMVMRYYPKKAIKNKVAYYFFTSIIFGFIHVPSLTSIEALIHFIKYAYMGGFLAYTYLKRDNIWDAIILHSLNNLVAFITVLFS